MSLTSNLIRFVLSLKLVLGAFIVSALAFGYYVAARDAIREANESRHASTLLMQELRQSSDDLTRMVRTYVVTGDLRFRNQFNEILAIRDGLAPRPEAYEHVYWDLVLDDRRPTPAGTASALLQRMQASGFTDEEMSRLAASKQGSDQLALIEREAIALVESGTVTPEQRLQAARMLSDARYHRAKADIMRPIAEVVRIVDARTAGLVADAERDALHGLIAFVLSGVLLVFTVWWTYRSLQRVFGGSVSDLRVLAGSSADAAVPLVTVKGNGDPDSIIGKLAEAQQVRAMDAGRRKETEQAISEAERKLRNIVGALDDGVCVVQDALIRFVNSRFQQMLERPEEDLLDRPYIQFVYEDDRKTLIERYRKRGDSVPVEPVVEFRVLTEPGELRRVSSRGTEFEWAGRPATLYFLTQLDGPATSA